MIDRRRFVTALAACAATASPATARATLPARPHPLAPDIERMRRIHLEYRYLARGNSAEEELRFVIHRSRLCHRAQKLRWELAARGVSQRRVDRAMKLARASAGRDYGTGADDSGNEQWPR